MPGAVRAFLAADVEPEIHAALVALKRDLARTGAAVRWVRDDGLHATVKFLGAVPEETLARIAAALAAPLGAIPRPRAAVRGLGVFPSADRPRVVWAGVECPPLAEVARAVDTALEPLGFAPERRPFVPHITLARVSGGRGWGRLAAALRARGTEDFGVCELAGLVLYRSDLRPGGAVYTKLGTIPFGG